MDPEGKLIRRLTEKYCTGEISESELLILKKWMQESSENSELVSKSLKIYRSLRAYEAYNQISIHRDYLVTIQKIRKNKHKRRLTILKYTAVILLFLGIFSIFTWTKFIKPGSPPIELANTIGPGEQKATLVLENGNHILLDDIGDSTFIRTDGVVIQKEGAELNYQESKIKKEVFNTVKVPRGGEYSLILSDGTKVWLNADSEITYPVNFVKNKRVIAIKGEVFLDVTHNSELPFIVKTKNLTIEVLGTSFNVKAYTEEDVIQTTLVTGKVKLYQGNKKTGHLMLTPGKQGSINSNTNEVLIQNVDTELYTSWKDGEFKFRNLNLQEIMLILERWYDINVHFEDTKLENLHFTGDLERYENINTHLDMISLTTNIKFTIDKNDIYITSK